MALHGLARRLTIMERCIHNAFHNIPPTLSVNPSRESIDDATISLHAFIIHITGCLDNAAHIWKIENNIQHPSGKLLHDHDIGLLPKNSIIFNSLSVKLKDEINQYSEWIKYILSFRHSLAHQIPLYIPPSSYTVEKYSEIAVYIDRRNIAHIKKSWQEYDNLTKKIDKFMNFIPVYTQSLEKDSRYFYFHAQMIADMNTVLNIVNIMYEELADRQRVRQIPLNSQ